MLHVDGAEHSGSGTIVRFAVALAALRRVSLHVTNARARRPKPGLRPQHVAAVRACAELCDARTEGLRIGTLEFTFVPGSRIRGGSFAWDIGTAGSTTMLALGILPLAVLAESPLTARITGGVFQDFAPSPHHMRHVLAPLLGRMGAAVTLDVIRPGYVPTGAGVIELRVRPVGRALAPLHLIEQGHVRDVFGIALASHLADRAVSDRMARTCESRLTEAGLTCAIERLEDTAAAHPGASLAIWAESSSACLFGADQAGARGRPSEAIGRHVAESLLADLQTGATVDRHIADQLVSFAALAEGVTEYVAPKTTAHVETNLWLAERFGATVDAKSGRVRIGGIAVRR